MVVSILVLEETLGIKPLSVDQEHELLLNLSDVAGISIVWQLGAVEGLSSGVVKGDIHRSFKVLLSENLVDLIAEFSPLDMVSGLWRLELFAEKFELGPREHDLAHVESDSELTLSDEAASKFIEISEELRDSDSLLLAQLSELGQNILDIFWLVLFDVNACDSWSSLWVVVERVVVASAHAKELLGRVDVIAEIEIVHLIDVSSVHVSLEKAVENLLRC